MRTAPHRLTSAMMLIALALGCQREAAPQPDPVAQRPAKLELGPIRRALVDGLEAAANDPVFAARLALAATLESPDVGAAFERSLARVAAHAELSRVADGFFAELQDTPAMRAALLEYAQQNRELELSELTAGFVGHVEQRLTRPELARELELALRLELRGSNVVLARALVIEADGGSAIAAAVFERLADPKFVDELGEWLGREGLQALLERRVAEPARAGELLVAIGARVSAPVLASIIDEPSSSELLAAALSRLLLDADVRTRCEAVFALALAAELDEAGFGRALAELLDEPAVRDEAAALLRAIASQPATRERVRAIIQGLATDDLNEALLAALD